MIPEAAAQVATKAIPVEMHGGSTTTGMITSGGIVTIILMLAYALIKIAPKWRELGIGQRKDDMDELRDRITVLERRTDEANQRATTAERATNEVRMHMVTLNTACALLAGELAKVSPGNPVLIQAKELIRLAASEDMGWSEEGKKLAMMPGLVREAARKEQEGGSST
jgi:hypothetical protein